MLSREFLVLLFSRRGGRFTTTLRSFCRLSGTSDGISAASTVRKVPTSSGRSVSQAPVR